MSYTSPTKSNREPFESGFPRNNESGSINYHNQKVLRTTFSFHTLLSAIGENDRRPRKESWESRLIIGRKIQMIILTNTIYRVLPSECPTNPNIVC